MVSEKTQDTRGILAPKGPPCPWCVYGGTPLDAAHQTVSCVVRPGGCRGQTVTPWDMGGWRCSGCGVSAPSEAWARAIMWAAADLGLTGAERDEAVRFALARC